MADNKQDETLVDEIRKCVRRHRRWETIDFSLAQFFLWIGILASVSSTLYAAGGIPTLEEQKWLAAIIAAIPAAVIVIDKTFKFAARASWHAIYRASCNGLMRRLRDQNATADEVSRARSALEMKMETLFPPLDTGMLGPTKE